jgi:hypothetical protein
MVMERRCTALQEHSRANYTGFGMSIEGKCRCRPRPIATKSSSDAGKWRRMKEKPKYYNA